MPKLCLLIGPTQNIASPDGDEQEPLDDGDRLMDLLIRPVVNGFPELSVERSDEIRDPTIITSRTLQLMQNADLVIADLSFLNANAFYELAIRHSACKPVVHICKEQSSIPFDLAPVGVVRFDLNEQKTLESARTALADHIRRALDPSYVLDNPVLRARGSVVSDSSPPEPVPAPLTNKQTTDLADRIESVATALNELRLNSAGEHVQELLKIVSELRAKDGATPDDVSSLTERILVLLGHIDEAIGSSRLGKLVLSGALAALVTGGGLPSVAVFSLSLAVWEGPEFFRMAIEKYLASKRAAPVSTAPHAPRKKSDALH